MEVREGQGVIFLTRRGTAGAREIWNSRASARELIAGCFGEVEDGVDTDVGEGDAWEVRSVRCRTGEDIDASL